MLWHNSDPYAPSEGKQFPDCSLQYQPTGVNAFSVTPAIRDQSKMAQNPQEPRGTPSQRDYVTPLVALNEWASTLVGDQMWHQATSIWCLQCHWKMEQTPLKHVHRMQQSWRESVTDETRYNRKEIMEQGHQSQKRGTPARVHHEGKFQIQGKGSLLKPWKCLKF